MLACSTELVVLLQPADDERALLLSEELGGIREVLDDPEGSEAGKHGNETFEDEDPRPTRFPADAIHVGDRGLQSR